MPRKGWPARALNTSRSALIGTVFFTQIAMIEADGDRAAAGGGDWLFAHRRHRLVIGEGASLTRWACEGERPECSLPLAYRCADAPMK